MLSVIKGRGSALLGEYKEKSNRQVSGASAHPIYIGMASNPTLFWSYFPYHFLYTDIPGMRYLIAKHFSFTLHL